MNTYALIITLLLATLMGLFGLILVLPPMKSVAPKMTAWYKKIMPAIPTTRLRSDRLEPSLRDTGLNHLQLISETHSLLFEENIFDHRTFSILYLMSPPGQYYTGYILWQALMNQKLRYGTMKVFHAYEADNINGRILFSVTSALEPGYFDADHIDTIKIPGLCLFMHHHFLPQPLKTFEEMLKMGKRLEHLLGGTLCNHQRQPLSEMAIADYRAKLSLLANIKDHHG